LALRFSGVSTATIFPEYNFTTGITVESSSSLFARGSILRGVFADKKSPILYGYEQDHLAVYYRNSHLFQVAGFGFHSSVYEWLVVAGAKAQYKGVGQVNGAGDYGFLLTATDGQQPGGGGVDRFRIKIWDRLNGDGVVYDNVHGASDDVDGASPQALGGGSIVIHN